MLETIADFIWLQNCQSQWENRESGSEAMRMGEKAKEDKAEGRMAQGQRERMVSGFGEKDGGGAPALLLLHKLPALSTPTQCSLPLLPSDNVLHY